MLYLDVASLLIISSPSVCDLGGFLFAMYLLLRWISQYLDLEGNKVGDKCCHGSYLNSSMLKMICSDGWIKYTDEDSAYFTIWIRSLYTSVLLKILNKRFRFYQTPILT